MGTLMRMGEIICLIVAIALSAAGVAVVASLKKSKAATVLKIILIPILIAVLAFSSLWAASTEVRIRLTKFEFLATPSLFDSGDTYSVMWATSTASTGRVEIALPDGTVKTFTDAKDGLSTFSLKIHRVDIEKSYFADGAKYRVRSRKAYDTKGYEYDLAEEVISDYYSLKPVNTSGSVSFMCISDVQNAYKECEDAINNAQDIPYDFVVMLGDYANYYNYEEDIIDQILRISAAASKGEIPVLYTSGNHDNKGTISKYLNRIMPTPSPNDELYYTWSYGPLFAIALNFGDDHNDTAIWYNGFSEFDAYKDAEYEWLLEEVVEKKPYEGFSYTVSFSHIPFLDYLQEDDGTLTPVFNEDKVCWECNETHFYKQRDFRLALEGIGLDYAFSGHTHAEPRVAIHPDCSFPNLQGGSEVSPGDKIIGYRNSIVHCTPEGITYEVFKSSGLS